MFAWPSVRTIEPARQGEPGIGAVVYQNDRYPDAVFKWIVGECRARGLVLSGVLQYPAFEGADQDCDVVLEDIASGHRTRLFEDRGKGARGCRLDTAALLEAAMEIERSFDDNPSLLVLNKFGKVEAEGGGMCGVMAKALERGIPVVIGVPARNLKSWRNFADGFSTELPEDTDRIADWLARLGLGAAWRGAPGAMPWTAIREGGG